MKVCVVGMWHLGTVTAACLASMGHEVCGFDPDERTVAALNDRRPPLYEPGLSELIGQQLDRRQLSFSSDPKRALAGAEVVWIAYDTPVDENDVADVDGVVGAIESLFPHIEGGAVVLISSQLIAGCTRQLQQRWNTLEPAKRVDFAYSPENLRLGKALEVFLQPDRVVVGANADRAREQITQLMAPFADKILWMSIESAEMTKHALNAFLAMCVSFANEVAGICERIGADAKEVERGLKSEQRIGPRAYLAPGAAFAGGTLARDVQYLKLLAGTFEQPLALVSAIKESNDLHRGWERRRLSAQFGSLRGVKVAVLGLTYKPGPATLRRSTAVELCRWLLAEGAVVSAHDPRVRSLPDDLPIRLDESVAAAVRDVQAVVIATPWPEYKELAADTFAGGPLVLDAARVAHAALATAAVEYVSVGTPLKRG